MLLCLINNSKQFETIRNNSKQLKKVVNSTLILAFSLGVFACNPSESIEEVTSSVNIEEKKIQTENQKEEVEKKASNTFIFKGKEISEKEYEAMGDEVLAIAGLKDTYTQYVFENREEAIKWVDSFGDQGKELSKKIMVSGILAEFAEVNKVEEEFEKTGEIPKIFTDFQSETFLKYYGKDFSDNSTERTEGVGSIHDDCYWTGRTGYVYGPRAVFWALDQKVSSYRIVFVSWLAFHDKRFYRGKSLWLWPPNYERTFCDYYTGWNNRARSLTTFIAI